MGHLVPEEHILWGLLDVILPVGRSSSEHVNCHLHSIKILLTVLLLLLREVKMNLMMAFSESTFICIGHWKLARKRTSMKKGSLPLFWWHGRKSSSSHPQPAEKPVSFSVPQSNWGSNSMKQAAAGQPHCHSQSVSSWSKNRSCAYYYPSVREAWEPKIMMEL